MFLNFVAVKAYENILTLNFSQITLYTHTHSSQSLHHFLHCPISQYPEHENIDLAIETVSLVVVVSLATVFTCSLVYFVVFSKLPGIVYLD